MDDRRPLDKTEQDTHLYRHGVPEDVQDHFHTARIVVEASCRPGSKLSVEEIAEITQFSVARVREVMCSAKYREAVYHCIEATCRGFIYSGLSVLHEIAHNPKEAAKDRIAAVKELRETALSVGEIKHQRDANAGTVVLNRLLEVLGTQEAVLPSPPITTN